MLLGKIERSFLQWLKGTVRIRKVCENFFPPIMNSNHSAICIHQKNYTHIIILANRRLMLWPFRSSSATLCTEICLIIL